MARFFVRTLIVNGDTMVIRTRKVTNKGCYAVKRDGEHELATFREVGFTQTDCINRLLRFGYVEIKSGKLPFYANVKRDPLLSELRTDALATVAKYRNLSDADFLRRWCTDRRREQLERGEITAEKARLFAEKRMERAVFTQLHEQEKELERIRNGNAPDSVNIVVEYGHGTTVRAYATIGSLASGRYTRVDGTAGGWGYDKTSAAVADALNKSYSTLKMLLTEKERALQAGKTDTSSTATCGRDNEECLGYGAGYGVIPYFAGGVGMSSLAALFTRHGYTMQVVDAPHTVTYLFQKKGV